MRDLKEHLAVAIIAETSISVVTKTPSCTAIRMVDSRCLANNNVILPFGCNKDLILCEFSSSLPFGVYCRDNSSSFSRLNRVS